LEVKKVDFDWLGFPVTWISCLRELNFVLVMEKIMTTIVMPEAQELVQSGGDFVNKPGWAHLTVKNVEVPAKNRDGQIIQNVACRLMCEVLNHSEPDQIGRQMSYLVRLPNPSQKDGGKFVTVIIVRLAQAMGVLPAAQPGQQVQIDWNNAINRQFAANLTAREWTNDNGKTNTSIEVNAAKIWGINDSDLPKECPIARNAAPAAVATQAAPVAANQNSFEGL